MSNLNIFFPYMSNDEIKAMEVQTEPNRDLPALNREIEEVVETLFPIDPLTGNPTSAVTKLLSPTVSALEKEKYAKMMEAIPTDNGNRGVDDDTLMATLPSRRNMTMTDNDKFANHIANFTDYVAESGKETTPANTEPSANVSAEPATSSAE